MQVTQTLSEGLKQEFKVVLPASDLAAKLESQLAEVRAKAQIKGFRPGKAPIAHLKKLYGKSIMGEVLQEAVNDANRKIVEENNLRVASGPQLDLPEDRETIEKLLEAAGDFAFVVKFETLPTFEIGAFDDISLERPVAAVSDEEVEKAVNQFADRVREYEPRAEEGAKAEKGDKLSIDFEGKLDGVPFEGGTGGDVDLVLGSGMFIPGFEEQLEGVVKGEKRLVKTRFPEDYSAANLAGKDAEFDVTVKEVSAPKSLNLDDELAKKYGFESLEAMRAAVRANIEADFDKASRDKLKRQLLDALDKRYSFDLPSSLVDQEFQGIWREVEKELAKPNSKEVEGKSEDELRADYRAIAERRVRLGLVLAEIGQRAGVTVDDKDLTEAVVERARQFPGQEKQIWDFYRNNEQALASLRAPIYEERVVAYLSSLVKIAEKTVTREELFAEDEEDAA
jgi:trigger factor